MTVLTTTRAWLLSLLAEFGRLEVEYPSVPESKPTPQRHWKRMRRPSPLEFLRRLSWD